jgi:NAD(P)-dependent dehydrogenase (short-subunit alcohol dehydrogenase family)
MTFGNYKGAVLITGGTGGIGLHCAQQIAAQRPDLLVIVASRVSLFLFHIALPFSKARRVRHLAYQDNRRQAKITVAP